VENNGEESREARPPRNAGAGSPREKAPLEAAVVEKTAQEPPPVESPAEVAAPAVEVEVAAAAAEPTPAPAPAEEPAPPAEAPAGPPEVAPGQRGTRWRGLAAVERVYWEGNNLFFDLAMRQEDGQVRYYRHIHRNQLTEAEGWADLVRVPLPPTGIEVVRSTASGEEVLFQFRDMQNGRVDPRVRRKAEFPAGSPWAYAIEMYHRDNPLKEELARWWGNVGYLRIEPLRVDLVYRDEEGRDHIYYAAERALLSGEWQELLRVWNEAPLPVEDRAAGQPDAVNG
jgi:hypothetical protein